MSDINYQEIAEKLNRKIEERNSYRFYGQIKSVFPALSKFVKAYDIEKVGFEKVDKKIGEIENLVLDFLYDLDPELEENVLKVIEDVDHTVMFVSNPKEKAKGSFVALRELNGKRGPLKKSPRVEIGLRPQNTSMGLATVGHEFGHILSQRIQERKFPKTDLIGEIEGVFLEKIFADWLLRNNKISKSERDKMNVVWRNNFLLHSRTICEEVDLLSRLKKNISAVNLQKIEKELQDNQKFAWKEVLKNRIGVFINGLDGKEIHGEYEFRYIVGEIVAGALYEDFKKEPTKTIERFKEYLAHNAEYEFFKKEQVLHDGKVVEKVVFDKKECTKCFSALLGENFKEKLSNAIKTLENSFEKTKTA